MVMNQYRVLIVDDEIHSIRGVQAGVNWEKLSISTVYTANNLRTAQEVFQSNKIDLLLCDIEMPKGSGLDLLKWVREHYPCTEAVFLTCHSDFKFAQQALQLKSFDYLLKPIDYQELEEVIQKALGKIQSIREAKLVEESYLQLKTSHHNVIKEKFWRDMIQQVFPATKESIEKQMQYCNIDYPVYTTFLPILIHVQNWNEELTNEEEKIMNYALQKAVDEEILSNENEGYMLSLETGRVVVILPSVSSINKNEQMNICNRFISHFSHYFQCELCCYIGNQVKVYEVLGMINQLQEMDRNNVTKCNQTLQLSSERRGTPSIPLIPAEEWMQLMKCGSKDKLANSLNNYFINWKESNNHITAQSLHLFYQDFLQGIFYVLQVKEIQANQVFSQNLLTEKPEKVLKSLNSLHKWVMYVTEVAMNQLHPQQEKESVVEIVKRFIKDNIGEMRLSRDEIANYVYLNPDYLTRLFKKQTGFSISDYLQLQRIEYAKKLLIETDLPVSEVALSAGYSNFSYFSTIFKKMTQLNPMEYRKTTPLLEKSE
jgi:two-component system, response regulator YesN